MGWGWASRCRALVAPGLCVPQGPACTRCLGSSADPQRWGLIPQSAAGLCADPPAFPSPSLAVSMELLLQGTANGKFPVVFGGEFAAALPGFLQGWGPRAGFAVHSSLAGDSGVTAKGQSSSRTCHGPIVCQGSLRQHWSGRVILGCSQEGLEGIPGCGRKWGCVS